MDPVRVPWILRKAFPKVLCRIPTDRKEIYLTFDDGPTPVVTPWVLDTLKAFDAKATFFCIGKNCEAEPAIMQRIKDEGHAVGNHTWDHPRGRNTPFRSYLRNVIRGARITGSVLFRPPYGSLTRSQLSALGRRYQVVYWDVLSGDYDPQAGGSCSTRVLRASRLGSIVVFHDSRKAELNLRAALPKVLEELRASGYSFRALPTARPV